MLHKDSIRKVVYIILAALCLTPWFRSWFALLLGLLGALTIGNPYGDFSKRTSGMLLRTCIVFLGFGMNFHAAMQAGKQGFAITVVSILGTLLLGMLIGKWLGVNNKVSHLVSAGTAICGGSAIAAVAPIVQAEKEEMSVSLGVVFILNSIALFTFPYIGHCMHLSQQQFGTWSAIAIHDTSSVVGAAGVYGKQALEIATTIKMMRTLWIIPVALIIAMRYQMTKTNIKIPWFIGLFVIAMLINTYLMQSTVLSTLIFKMGEAGLRLTLYLIGSGLSVQVLRAVGIKPFLQGLLLWIVISATALLAVMKLAI